MLCLIAYAVSASAETLDWSTRPNVNLLSGSDVATPGIVTVTSSATGSGLFSTRTVNIQPAGTLNTHTGIVLSTVTPGIGAASNTVTFAFSRPVYNLCFTVVDIDGAPAALGVLNFNDIVQFSPVPTSAPVVGTNVNYNAGTGGATSNGAYVSDTTGDIRVCYAGPLSSVSIQHSTSGLVGLTQHDLGIDDLTYSPPPTVTLTKISNGGVGGFTFNGSNGFGAAQTITTITSGVGVAGATRIFTSASTVTTITETVPAGYGLASATCSGIGAGTATLAGSVLTLDALATAPGNAAACTFTNTKLPTVTLTKISTGGVGGFTFNGDNGFGAAQTITTITSGVGVNGAIRTLAAASTVTTITETIPAGYALASATCSGMGSGGTATPNLATGTLAIDVAATAAGSNIACTFTNTKLPTMTLTKISNGGVGPFVFNGDNGFGAAQTITTVTSGVGVAGATRTLTSVSTVTTLTETVPVGYLLTAASCSGIGAGTATPNLAAGSITLNAAATAPGNVIACTFTNGKRPSITLTKISNGAVGGFTFTGSNGWADQTITTVTSGGGVAGATQTLTTASTVTTITEAIPAGYVLASVTCSGLGGGTATPNLGTGAVVLDATATAAANSIACTFTDTKLPTVKLTKISNGAVGGFTFTGSNGWASQTITTVTTGIGVAGATQILTAAATATTITEAIPPSYFLTAVNCSGLGSGGTATPNLSTGVLDLDAAATAPGADIACTFTNSVPSFSISKTVDLANVAAPATIAYTITIQNTGGVELTGLSISDSLLQGASARTLTSGPAYSSGDTDNDSAIDPAETWIYGATYEVTQADIDDGSTFSNTATFDTAQTIASMSNAATTTVTQSAGLAIDKSADTAGPVSVGNIITYTFKATNTGNTTISAVTITDAFNGHGTAPVPGTETLSIDAAPTGNSTDATPNNGIWSILAPGDEVTFTAPYTVTQADVDLLQ